MSRHSSRTGGPLLVTVLSSAMLVSLAQAHGRSHSYSTWDLEKGGARVSVRIATRELTRLGPGAEATDRAGHYLAQHLGLLAAGVPCEPDAPPTPLPARPGWSAFGWRVVCPTDGGLAISSDVLLAQAPSHLHFARVSQAGGAPVQERVLSETDPVWPLQAGSDEGPGRQSAVDGAGTTLVGYIALGVEHIATGWDHIAFVLALLLLARTLGEVARLVTGFTIAHSLTLALAVLGVLRPQAEGVEAIIGFSVALVAAENAWILAGGHRAVSLGSTALVGGLFALSLAGVGLLPPLALAGLTLFTACHFALLSRSERPERMRAALAFAFGLVHGFGFAGVLAELSLPVGRLAPALFGFNVGVELGQLGIVAAAWPALRLLGRAADGRWQQVASEVASAAICGLGVYWLLTRALGA